MIAPVIALGAAASACAVLAGALLGWVLAHTSIAPRPELGHRGWMRGRALAGAFALVEPPMRALAVPVSAVPLGSLRSGLARSIASSGDYLGLDADECIALAVLGAGGLGGAALGLTGYAELPATWALLPTGLGAALPFMALRDRRALRTQQIDRALPAAIDLAALCMDAGLDFAGALALLTREAQNPNDHLTTELRRVLQELAMGRTRREALLGLRERVPTDAVRDFVNAVIQADDKGNPLVDVLQVQARVLRMRRSVAGEEAAARASVLLALPMVMLLACILLVMLGPFLLNGMGI